MATATKGKPTVEPNTPPPPGTPFPTAQQMQRAAHQREAAGDRTLAAVKERLGELRLADTSEYTAAVHATAAGEQPDHDKVTAAVAAAGKTADQFAADVEARRRRIELAAVAARRPAAEAELATAAAEAFDLEHEKARLLKEIDNKLIAAYGRRKRAEDAVSAAVGAEARLQRTYSGPLVKTMNDAQSRADAAHRRTRSLAFARDDAQARANSAAADPAKYPDGEAERQRARVAELNEQIRAAVKEQEAAVNELNAAAFGMRVL